MIRFLLLYFSIYLLMHAYAFYHARRSLQYGRKTTVFTVLFSIFMVLSPIIVRVAESKGLETVPRVLAFIGYSWMGILLLFVTVALVYDVSAFGRLVFQVIRKKRTPMTAPYLRRRFFVQLVVVMAIYSYGLFEANQIRTMNITITSPKISARAGKFRIVQISDVHLGLIVREKRLKKILEKVKEAEPALVVSTGDLVDGQLNDLTGVERMLTEMDPPFGKLAVTGNHEFYAGLEQSLAFTEKAGFMLLRNEVINVNGVTFVGVDDHRVNSSQSTSGEESELLRRQRRDMFTILLKHRPVVDPKSVGLFDIQLSGHVHKGQIFPFNLFTWLTFGYRSGMNALEYGYLYIANGSGTWGPPIRFLAPPEVTIIDLVYGA